MNPTSLPDLLAYQPPAWTERALCAQLPPEMGDEWFPDVRCNADAVKAVCGRCPVSDECLTYALDNNISEGIWAGTAGRQRARMRRLDGAA